MARSSRPQPGQLALFEDIATAPFDEVATAPVVEDDQPAAFAHSPIVALPAPSRSAVATQPALTRTRRRRDGSIKNSTTPRVPPAPSVLLDHAIPDYLTALAAAGRSQHTLKSFELDLRLLRGQLGNRPVGAIETGHLRQFIAWVRLSRENAPNSVRRKVATLKNFFTYLRDEGYIDSSPADLVPYPEAYVALPEFLPDDAADRLVAETDGNLFWRALLVLMLDTGLKRDEVLALRIVDVELSSEDGGYLVVRETDAAKRLRSRRLELSLRLREALHAHLATQPHKRGDEHVFDVSVRGINFIVETCGARAGIVTSKPRLTPQVLRETFAVAQMRARVRAERRRQMEGWNGEQMQLLTLRHDAELLELLGLKDDPDTARKYRQLARV